MIQAAQASGSGSFTPLLLIVLLFGIMYFMMIRPQQKRRREAQSMQAGLGPGDRVVTIGGLHATVVAVDDDVVTVEIAPGVVVRFARPAIARVVEEAAAVPEPVIEDRVVEDRAAQSRVVDSPAADGAAPESPVVETRKTTD